MPTRYCTGIRPPLHPLGASLNKTGLSPALIFFIVFLILLTIKFLSLSLFDCQETPLSHSLTFSLSFRSLVTARRTGGSGRQQDLKVSQNRKSRKHIPVLLLTLDRCWHVCSQVTLDRCWHVCSQVLGPFVKKEDAPITVNVFLMCSWCVSNVCLSSPGPLSERKGEREREREGGRERGRESRKGVTSRGPQVCDC